VGGDRRAAACHRTVRHRDQAATVLASSYLLGGSIVAWFRAGSSFHTDLHE
jgi:hypothetical protein